MKEKHEQLKKMMTKENCWGRDRVMEVLRKLDVPSVKQVIAVPEISGDWVLQRQLVEVPTERG